MIEVVLGAILGLGVFVLVSGPTASRLVQTLAPHIRDLASPPQTVLVEDGAVRVLATIVGAVRGVSRHRSRTRPRREVAEELPGALDLIALCVSTGMTIPTALERVATSGRGILANECRLVTSEINLGVSVSDALHASDRRLGHEGWSRVIEHLDIARRNGTPLIEILRSLAEDEQNVAGQRLLETASSKETLMMFPLVFVILPVTVVMAIFPGVTALGTVIL